MAFDFKKEYKEFYLPKKKPAMVEIPPMNYIAVRGKGDPNEEDGEYKSGIGLLYAIAYTIKMSYKGSYKIDGFFEYVVPPLEGLWWQEGVKGMDYSRKKDLQFISMIRLPDFVTQADLNGPFHKPRGKRNWIFPRWNFSLTMRVCVYSVCI